MAQQPDILSIEKNQQGFIFTMIEVNGEKVKAMIDFGDPHVLMVSTREAKRQNITLEDTGDKMQHINGQPMTLYSGIANSLKVSSRRLEKVEFFSAANEIEGVSEQVGTPFDAVLGWGFFSQSNFSMDYQSLTIEFLEEENRAELGKPIQYEKSSNYIVLPLYIAGKEANVILDTGSGISLVDQDWAKPFKKTRSPQGFPMITEKIRKGSLTLEQNFELMDLSMLSTLNAIGILGSDFINRFKLTFIPDENLIYLKG
ncbi:hypothetical protein BFP97_12210 [Roseivirga sp. 4D4]|nr:hypothetical protein BFP97_12210 [Roseivirga sp. 4D4]